MKDFCIKHKSKIITISIIASILLVLLIFTPKDYTLNLKSLKLAETHTNINKDNNYTIKYSKLVDDTYEDVAYIHIDNAYIHIELLNEDDIYLEKQNFLYDEYMLKEGSYTKKQQEFTKYDYIFFFENLNPTEYYEDTYIEDTFTTKEKDIKIVLNNADNYFVFTIDLKIEYVMDTNNKIALPI